MRKLSGLLLGVAVAALAACGDNSNDCGPGTHAEEGLCVPDDGTTNPPNCGDGTMLDAETNTCVIDPDSCQGGTVLIDGDCVDPTEGLTVDVTEGAEPNALGVGGEDSDEPAGIFEIKPIGATTVVQGVLKPRADVNEDGADEPDYDTYLFEADGPALLEISVDGTAGVQGAFGLLADPSDPQVADFLRIGTNLNGDTSRRQVYLPKAGIYLLAVADTRSLTEGIAAGGDDGKYFVSIAQKAIPTPTAMTVTNGTAQAVGSIDGGVVDFYTAETGSGLTDAFIDSFDPTFTASPELVVAAGSEVRGFATYDPSVGETRVRFGGNTTGTTLFVVDQVQNNSLNQAPYRVRLKTTTGTRMSVDGAVVTAVSPGTTLTESTDFDFEVDEVGYFFVDVAQADQITGMNLAFSAPVAGDVYNDRGEIVAAFTYTAAAGSTFTSYKGLARFRAAGRYYFAFHAPTSAAGASVSLTSTVTPITPAQLVFDAPAADVAPNVFNSVPYRYSINAEPWQQYKLAADTATGGARLRVLSLATTYGRLDVVNAVSATNVPTVVSAPAGTFSVAAPAGGENFAGRIVPGAVSPQLLLVNTTAAAGTFDLEVDKRTYTDLGDHAAPYTGTSVDQPVEDILDDGDTHRFFIKSAPGNVVTVTVTPEATLDVGVSQLNAAELLLADSDEGYDGDEEVIEGTVNAAGYFAFDVYGFSVGTFDVAVEIQGPAAPPATFYTVTTGTSTWMNVCAMPSARDITPTVRTNSLTEAVTLPAGFDFYSTPVDEMVVSTSGFLTFDTTNAFTENWFFDAIPTDYLPAQAVAPMWGYLSDARICTMTSGTKTYVQWRAYDLFTQLTGGTPDIGFLAILDASNDTIEFVYPSWFPLNGISNGATGVQEDDLTGQEIIFTTNPAGTSRLLTPNPT